MAETADDEAEAQEPDVSTPVRSGARPRPSVVVSFGLTAGAILLAVSSPDPVAVGGAVGLLGIAVATLLRRSPEPFGDQTVLVCVGMGVLTASGAGIVEQAEASQMWKPLVAVLAYPLLGRALLRHVRAYRVIRDADLVVEAVVIGAAVTILLQVGVDWRTTQESLGWPSAHSVLPSLLVGLDTVLIVILARSLEIPTARRGQLGIISAGVTALLGGHLVAVVGLPLASANGTVADALVAAALVIVGASALHPRAGLLPVYLHAEAPLFSGSHAVVIVLAILAAPSVLVILAVQDITASIPAAAGMTISGAVLASYLVGLLRERADSEHQATHDALTSLPNRVLFMDRLERAVAHAERSRTPVAALFIDLDGFKDVNDTLGHVAGDRLLQMTAGRLVGCLRNEDTVARLGGDEFAVLLPHLSAPDDVFTIVERVVGMLREPVTVAEHRIRNTASIGVAVFPRDGRSADELLVSADSAMYQAKDRGGNTSCFGAKDPETLRDHLETETALFNGIERGELVLHFQPIVDATDGRLLGAEALVRWEHPEKGLLSPGQFVPVAERSDLVVVIDQWVIDSACQELARWSVAGFTDRFLSVNISGRHFRHDLVSTVTSALRASGADARNLVLELTESTAVDNIGAVAEALRELRNLGVRAAIDDFGTGYCGLQYLGDLPVSTLKLDKSFVQAMTPRSAAIVAATIAMGHSLGLSVVAEGVETAEQQRVVSRSGCDRLQGYHIGRPMPSDAFLELLRGERLDAATDGTQKPRLYVAN